ncbi:glycosyltransferase [Microbulbifer taiwanensis]|uniref:Glycosyltransferase n=1 Tax=Microbulbifer taiwanensis TaxID=986746 RepID=A0ABW1YUF2_9GAMM|nr:glycosyltransferase [Microbulbifer taiwanensis]
MKVLHCYRTFYPETQGGIEQSIFEMARYTAGSEVLTLSNTPGAVSVNGIPVKAERRWLSMASCCMGPSLVSDLYKKQADIVHLHFPWPFGDLSYLLGGRRRPLIVTYHSDIVRQRALGAVYGPLMRLFLNRADRIVATSPDYLASSPVLREFVDKVEVIPLGISESSYPQPAAKSVETLRERFDDGFMLFVGALRYYKGLEFLVRSAPGLPFPILIAGKGPEEKRLRALANSLGAENVHFLGHVDDEEKMALLHLCRAVVFPSHLRSEAFGVTLLEGMMAGKPLISCDIGTGTSFVNLDGETGHVIPPADVSALRAAMLDLSGNREKAADWGSAARARYEATFTGRKMAEAYGHLYRRVLTERADKQAVA